MSTSPLSARMLVFAIHCCNLEYVCVGCVMFVDLILLCSHELSRCGTIFVGRHRKTGVLGSPLLARMLIFESARCFYHTFAPGVSKSV